MPGLPVLVLVLFCIFLNVTGQISLKYGASRLGPLPARQGIPFFLLQVVKNPFVLTSLGCAFTSLLLWLIILSRAELSAVYPMLALSYALTAMAARLLLGEQLSSLRVLGITLICLGVFLIARS